jgi:hypothetical protein
MSGAPALSGRIQSESEASASVAEITTHPKTNKNVRSQHNRNAFGRVEGARSFKNITPWSRMQVRVISEEHCATL